MVDHFRIAIGAGAALAAALLALCSTTFALSPPPPQPDDELLPLLFETLGGEDWHNNEGWLDPEVHWCDWHGIVCGEPDSWGYRDLLLLELPGNNLAGEMTPELSELLFRYMAANTLIDLSNNGISGQLYNFPGRTQQVNLSGNRFSGQLPGIDEEQPPIEDRELLLAHNRFEGAVPESWQQLALRELDLADNGLDAGHLNAFEAMSRVDWSWLNLAGNEFSGELTTGIFPARLNRRDGSNVGGGLNICFNNFVIDNPDVQQWVEARHIGGADFEQCLNRERAPVDATVSGSWYHPERAGEGVSLMLLENGSPLIYHFGFDAEGRQQWLFEVGTSGERFMQWQWLLETRGTFNSGLRFDGDHPFIRGVAQFRMDRVGSDAIHLHRHYYDLTACGPWEPSDPNGPPPAQLCPPPLLSDRLDYQRLSQVAGTTCEKQSSYQGYSGAWYNPERSGEGFIVEVLPGEKAVVYWFTHKPDGSGEQAWMIGQGEIFSQGAIPTPFPGTVRGRIVIESMVQPTGGTFGSDFDPDVIEHVDWGRVEIAIAIDGSDGAIVGWESNVEGYGSGSYELERLARPMLAECNQS